MQSVKEVAHSLFFLFFSNLCLFVVLGPSNQGVPRVDFRAPCAIVDRARQTRLKGPIAMLAYT